MTGIKFKAKNHLKKLREKHRVMPRVKLSLLFSVV